MSDNVYAQASELAAVNNIMRHKGRLLSQDENLQMLAVKNTGLAMVMLLHQVGGTTPTADGTVASERTGQSSAELTLAQRKIEEAVMWAVKHITR